MNGLKELFPNYSYSFGVLHQYFVVANKGLMIHLLSKFYGILSFYEPSPHVAHYHVSFHDGIVSVQSLK